MSEKVHHCHRQLYKRVKLHYNKINTVFEIFQLTDRYGQKLKRSRALGHRYQLGLPGLWWTITWSPVPVQTQNPFIGIVCRWLFIPLQYSRDQQGLT